MCSSSRKALGGRETVCSNHRGCPQVASLPLESTAKGQESPSFSPPSQTGCSQARGAGFPLEFPCNRVSVTIVKLVDSVGS